MIKNEYKQFRIDFKYYWVCDEGPFSIGKWISGGNLSKGTWRQKWKIIRSPLQGNWRCPCIIRIVRQVQEGSTFFIEGLVIVELKALIQLEDVHLAQAINYLEAFDLEVGLLINFGAKSLQFKRLSNKSFKQKNQGNPEIK